MIRTITTYSGESAYAQAAQAHAIQLALGLNARLRAVAVWDADSARDVTRAGENLERLAEQDLETLKQNIRAAGIQATESLRGEGVTEALLSEAQMSDLLVLGLPTEDADLVVIGGTTYGFLDRFLGRDTPEKLALATHRPVLIAR